MIDIIYSPTWFYGKDIVFDIINVFVLFLIAFFVRKYYKLAENKNYLYLAISFFMVGVSFLFKIMMNFTIYYHILETRDFGIVTFTYHTMRSSDTLFFVGFLIYRRNNYSSTKLLMLSFSILIISQVLFIFMQVERLLYAIAEIIQLAGYLLLLATFL